MILSQPPCLSAGHCLSNLLPVALRRSYTIKFYLLQSPVTIAEGVDSSPIEYIFSYNGSPISVSTGSTPQCTSSSCQHTFRVSSSQVQQYRVSVAVRNVVGVGNPSLTATVGMWCYTAASCWYCKVEISAFFGKLIWTHNLKPKITCIKVSHQCSKGTSNWPSSQYRKQELRSKPFNSCTALHCTSDLE